MGVSAHADGGFVGGSNLSDNAADYNLFNEANRNVATGYNESSEGNYNRETAPTYEPVSAEREGSSGMAPVQVQVSLQPEFVISACYIVYRRHIDSRTDRKRTRCGCIK